MSQFKTKPYEHQQEALDKMDGQANYAILAGVGTGKSKIMIDDASRLYRQGAIDTLVILSPIGVHRDAWVGDDETPGLVAQHLPDDIPREVAYTVTGKPSYGLAKLEPMGGARELKVASVHYEALSSGGCAVTVANIIKRAKGCMIVADESQKLRSPGSKRTKVAWRYGQLAQFRRITTGTPLSQGWQDLYAQYKFLDWSIIGCRTFTEFKAQYCLETRYDRFTKITGYRNVPLLERLIAPVTYQIAKNACLDLPAQHWQERSVLLTSEQMAAYKSMEKDLMLELSSGVVLDVENAVTRILRLEQIVAGHLPDGSGGWTPLNNNRVDAAVDICQQTDGKVLIWCRFIPDRVQLAEAFKKEGIGFAVYEGKERSEALAKWRRESECQVLIANPVSGGTGLTLNEAATVIHYTLSFNFEDLEQSEGRNHRIGQTQKVTYITLRAKGTTNDHVIRTLRGKRNIADALRSSVEIAAFARRTEEFW